MSKKSIKIISAIITVMLAVTMLTSTAFAISSPSQVGSGTTTGGLATNVTSAGRQIVGLIRTVGMLISVAILMVLGIKYMMGSAEEKASYKKTMMPYLIGAVLLFGASAIAEAVYNMANDLV